MTAVELEPTPLRTGALSQRLRPLGQTVLMPYVLIASCAPIWARAKCMENLRSNAQLANPPKNLQGSFINAPATSRARGRSMGGLCVAATLQALLQMA